MIYATLSVGDKVAWFEVYGFGRLVLSIEIAGDRAYVRRIGRGLQIREEEMSAADAVNLIKSILAGRRPAYTKNLAGIKTSRYVLSRRDMRRIL